MKADSEQAIQQMQEAWHFALLRMETVLRLFFVSRSTIAGTVISVLSYPCVQLLILGQTQRGGQPISAQSRSLSLSVSLYESVRIWLSLSLLSPPVFRPSALQRRAPASWQRFATFVCRYLEHT